MALIQHKNGPRQNLVIAPLALIAIARDMIPTKFDKVIFSKRETNAQ